MHSLELKSKVMQMPLEKCQKEASMIHCV